MKAELARYLDTVTAGLRDDPELQLDVRAELAVHVEDKRDALMAAGASAEDADMGAVAALGKATDVASELMGGNRKRLRRRAWVRRAARFLLVPLSVVVAILCSDLHVAAVPFALRQLGGSSGPLTSSAWAPTGVKRILGLRQDKPVLRLPPKELWESDPSNPIYYANYVTRALARKESLGADAFMALLAQADQIDPGNARYDYLRAAILLDSAVTIESRPPREEDAAERPNELPWTWTIKDRGQLDRAMEYLLAAIQADTYERRQDDMVQLRRDAVRPPRRLVERVARIAGVARVLLPDLQYARQLMRASVLYGDMLLAESRLADASAFLSAWEPMSKQLNGNTWCLIDCLVTQAIVHAGSDSESIVYRRHGLPERAERAHRRSEPLRSVVEEWQKRRNEHRSGPNAREEERRLRLRGGMLASLLLPSVGSWPAEDEYDAGRRVEYTVMMQALLTLVSAILVLAMFGCLVIALRWRFSRRGNVIPILLIPDWCRSLRILGFGVLLPLAIFVLVVTMLPISGQHYSYEAAKHKIIAEVILMTTAVLTVPSWLVAGYVRQRCQDLGIPVLNRVRRALVWLLLGAVAATAAAWCFPASLESKPLWLVIAPFGLLGLVLLTALGTGLRLLLDGGQHALHCGALARSLIPVFASAVILLCAIARPMLLSAEKHYLAADRIIGGGENSAPMFSQVEDDVVRSFRETFAEALSRRQPIRQN